MSERYGETVTTEQPPAPSKPEFGFRWFVGVAAAAGAGSYVFGAAYKTGNWVLVAAMWATLLSYGIVSYRRFAKRQRG